MAIHDLDMSRFLMGEEPQEIFATGSCHIDKSIEVLPAPECFDTATVVVKYKEGRTAMIDVCRQASAPSLYPASAPSLCSHSLLPLSALSLCSASIQGGTHRHD